MATVGTTNVTIHDIIRATGPDDKIAAVVEILSETNEVLDDMTMKECNDGTSHKTTIRTGYPSATWRKFNQGIQPSKGQVATVSDTTGMCESLSKIDKDLADLNGNTNAFRMSEDMAHIEAMNQEMVETFFYGDVTTDPEKFTGLSPRFATPSTTKNTAGYQLVNGGGSGSDNTSIWVVAWGDSAVHAIYPKGSKAGLTMDASNKAEWVTDGDGNEYKAYRTHYKWDMGLSVRDYRQVVRVCNIDVSDLQAAGTSGYSGADIINLLTKAVHRIRNRNTGRLAIYCNDTVITALDLIANNRSTLALKVDEVEGRQILKFRGIPIRRVDQILSTEAAITGTFAGI